MRRSRCQRDRLGHMAAIRASCSSHHAWRSGKWLDIKTVQSAEQAERLTDFVTGARGLFKRVEDARKGAKKPWDDLGRAVQDAYSPLTAKVEKIAKAMKAMQADWLKREDAGCVSKVVEILRRRPPSGAIWA